MAQGSLRRYSLAECVVTVNGIPIEGFQADDAVTYSPNSPLNESEVGADGEVTRSTNQDRSGTITFFLKASSQSNNVFNAFMQAAKAGLGIGDVFSVMVNNLGSGDKIIAPQTWIEQEPDVAIGRTDYDKEWLCRTANAVVTHGGALR